MVCNHLHMYDGLRTKPYNEVPQAFMPILGYGGTFLDEVGWIAPQPKGKVEKCNRFTTHMPLAPQA